MDKQQRDLQTGMKCVKYLLFSTCFMFSLIGFLLVLMGATIITVYSNFDDFLEEYILSPAKLTLALGFIIFLVSIFGCLGAIKQSTALTNIFALLLCIVLVMEVCGTIAAYAMRDGLKNDIRRNMKQSIQEFDQPYSTEIWDVSQELLGCCGIYNYKDWSKFNSTWSNKMSVDEWNSKLGVPQSCVVRQKTVYVEGCLDVLSDLISEGAMLLGAGGLCVVFIQLLGIILAHMLAKSFRSLKTQMLVKQERTRQNRVHTNSTSSTAPNSDSNAQSEA